jgi:hypothetical protein
MFQPPRWAIPPVQRVDVEVLQRLVEEIAPGTRVVIPQVFKEYDVDASATTA